MSVIDSMTMPTSSPSRLSWLDQPKGLSRWAAERRVPKALFTDAAQPVDFQHLFKPRSGLPGKTCGGTRAGFLASGAVMNANCWEQIAISLVTKVIYRDGRSAFIVWLGRIRLVMECRWVGKVASSYSACRWLRYPCPDRATLRLPGILERPREKSFTWRKLPILWI